jgi:hypothetical protein
VAELQQQIHDDLRRQHPEWIEARRRVSHVRFLRGAPEADSWKLVRDRAQPKLPSTLNTQLSTLDFLAKPWQSPGEPVMPVRLGPPLRSPTRRGELGARFRPGDAYRGRVTRSKGKRSTSAFRLRAFSRCLRTRIWLRT